MNSYLSGVMTFLVFLSLSMLPACGSTSLQAEKGGTSAPTDAAMAASVAKMVDDFGIEIVALRHSAAGHMIDFRFRVLDLDKAMPFFSKEIKPYLLDEKSGKSLGVPVPAKLGPMRPTGRNPKLGVTYWIFFGNPGLVQPGDRVTIVIGDYRLENLVVE